MKQELLTRWLEALTGGEFEQGDSSLRQFKSDGTHTHCCLGVIVEIEHPGAYGDPEYFDDGSEQTGWSTCNEAYGNDDATLLNEEYLAAIGMTEQAQTVLANLNDNGFPFDEIAKVAPDLLAVTDFPSDDVTKYVRELKELIVASRVSGH